MRVYFIGIGGIGMSGVAGLCRGLGFEVCGSEENPLYPPSSFLLKELGIEVFKPSEENLLKFKPDLVVVGNAISSSHIEVAKAKALRIPLLSFPEFIENFILDRKKALVIAGTHGKTTTSALLSFTLLKLEKSPTFLVGGILKDTGKNFAYGKGEFMLLEGDEYPSAFFNKNPKFLHYKPFGLILTSLEYDHADVYPDINALKEAFKKLLKLLPMEGILVFNQDDPNLVEIVEASQPLCKIITYGKGKADFKLVGSEVSLGGGGFRSKGLAKAKDGEVFEIDLSIPGDYNLLNALSTIALLETLGFHRKDILEAIKDFKGVQRRQEILFASETLLVIDDFAHHPTALALTLKELKKAFQPEKTILFFEPRTNSSKRKVFQRDYVEALNEADLIGIKVPPGLERIPFQDRIDLEQLRNDLEDLGKRAFILEKGLIPPEFFDLTQKSLVVFMSSAFMQEEIKLFFKGIGKSHAQNTG
ncbi:UDP-N-acetylmuramate [Caldimicrobium thiodismutans]|uniref:UDP-N-acetylmuramate n=1 Tax=Caldimicrobium thiodismutans TaxID=1653476 RepID=A0A0U5AZ90_9BACT|nr:Mur ligase family protein [Caldimicrobium thiodismutans]BAU23049.1 UDP-N-acetylmuramate [Caldimicrobium thiodismutans]